MALCLYNNAIQLAKLKVYKVTLLNHEKYIICYDRNYFKTNVQLLIIDLMKHAGMHF